MFGSLCKSDCGDVRFMVYRVWNGSDVSMAGLCVCIKDFVNFVM